AVEEGLFRVSGGRGDQRRLAGGDVPRVRGAAGRFGLSGRLDRYVRQGGAARARGDPSGQLSPSRTRPEPCADVTGGEPAASGNDPGPPSEVDPLDLYASVRQQPRD